MLRLTRRSEYGIIAMAHLAQSRDESVSARDIADKYGIPRRLLAEVMKDLVHRGLVRSTRGASGGYRLAVDPSKASVRSVLQALEGPFEMVQCTGENHPEGGEPAIACELLGSCPIRGPVQRIHDRIRRVLDEFTIDDLIAGPDGARVDLSLLTSHASASPHVAPAH